MRILILLPGKVYSSSDSSIPEENRIYGKDIFGNTHLFNRMEFVNNFLTIDGIRRQMSDNEIVIRHLTGRKHPLTWMKYAYHIRKMIYREQITLVHQFWGGPSALITTLFSPVPVIISFLGSDLLGDYASNGRKNLKGLILQLGSLLASAFASGVVVMSSLMKQKLPKRVQEKSVIIPEGVDTTRFFPMNQSIAKQYLNWNESSPVILFFDNGNRVKNAGFAHEIFMSVKKKLPECELKVVKRNIPHHLLVYYYNAADVLLLVSLHEGSNNSLKESMACNCPVISAATGDAAERLAHCFPGKVISGYNADDYVEALVNLLQEPTRSNGTSLVGEVSVTNISRSLADYYRLVAGLKPTG